MNKKKKKKKKKKKEIKVITKSCFWIYDFNLRKDFNYSLFITFDTLFRMVI